MEKVTKRNRGKEIHKSETDEDDTVHDSLQRSVTESNFEFLMYSYCVMLLSMMSIRSRIVVAHVTLLSGFLMYYSIDKRKVMRGVGHFLMYLSMHLYVVQLLFESEFVYHYANVVAYAGSIRLCIIFVDVMVGFKKNVTTFEMIITTLFVASFLALVYWYGLIYYECILMFPSIVALFISEKLLSGISFAYYKSDLEQLLVMLTAIFLRFVFFFFIINDYICTVRQYTSA